MLNDPLANALSNVLNNEQTGKKECLIHPASSLLKRVLTTLSKHRYVGSYEEITPAKGGYLRINLLGTINNIGVIKPRFAVSVNEFEKFEKRFLPAQDMGVLLVSTPKGIMTHIEAKKQHVGGKLLAYCY
ncbi:MAG: 30S ribosomal protein S8 [Nanoarchaeota archaeon]